MTKRSSFWLNKIDKILKSLFRVIISYQRLEKYWIGVIIWFSVKNIGLLWLIILAIVLCDDKTNKAQLHNLKNKTDTLVLHTYDEQMLYNMKHMLLDCKRTVDAMLSENVVANLS